MAFTIDENGNLVKKNIFSTIFNFGKDILQGTARDIFSISAEVSKRIGGAEELTFAPEETFLGKTQRVIFGTPEGRANVGAFEQEGQYITDLMNQAYGQFGLSKENAGRLGYGTQALFALTTFLPGKKTLVKELVEAKKTPEIISSLVKNGVERDMAISYAPFFAKAKNSSEVKGLLKQIDTFSKTARTSVKDVIEVPPLTRTGEISIKPAQQSSRDVLHLISLKEKGIRVANKVMNQEKEEMLKNGFKSTLQKNQEEFAKKLSVTIERFKKSISTKEEVISGLKKNISAEKTKSYNLKEMKSDLFDMAKNYFSEGSIKTSIVNKIVKASTVGDIRKAIISINSEFGKQIQKETINSIKNIIDSSDNFTARQKSRLAATITNIKMQGMSEATARRVENLRDFIEKNPERELLLGKKNTALLKRAEEMAKIDLKDLDKNELMELERRLSHIAESSKLEKKTRIETRKLKNDIAIDSIASDSFNKDIKGKIESIGKDLTPIQKVGNFWVSFKENAQKGNWSWISADNFFSEIGETATKVFKDSMDRVVNLSKKDYKNYANKLLGKEAEMRKKYGGRLKNENFERIMVYAIKQQKGGIDKLLKSEGITQKFIDSIELTEQEMDWYRFTRSELDTLAPKINDVLLDTTDGMKSLGELDNYFPMTIDFTKSEKLADYLFEDTYFDKRGMSKGFTKERKMWGIKDATYNMNARDVYLTHIKKASDFINIESTIKQLEMIAKSPKLEKSIGKDATSFIDEWLDTLSRGGISKGYKRTFFDDIRDNVGSAILGFRVSPIVKQPIAKITAGALLGPKHTFTHDIEYIKNNLNSLVEEASLQQQFRAFDDPSFDVGSLNKFQQWGYSGIKALDKLTSNNVWYSAYKKFFADSKIKFNLEDFKGKKFNEEAIKYADLVVRKTQGTGDVKDMAQIFRGDNRSFWKTIFQFQSFIMNQSQLLTIDMKNAILKEKDPVKALNIATFFVLSGLAESYVSSGLTGLWGTESQKKKEKEMDAPTRLADSLFGQIPLINNAISMAKFGSSGLPVVDVVKDVVMGTNSIFNSKTEKAKLKGASEAGFGVTSLFGVAGSGQLNSWLKSAIDSMEDETKPEFIPIKKPTKIKRASY
jgi:hypothetical protein